MKKIFAIALALVMVCSMASAFALNNCSANFAWPCDADVNFCGRGTVEVVPFVKVNNGCGGFDWQVNTCAGAVASENVYYAIKLNVEANPDSSANAVVGKPQQAYWWDLAKLTVTHKAVNNDNKVTFNMADHFGGIDWDADKTKSYYLLNTYYTTAAGDKNWIDVTDDDLKLNDVVFTVKVNDNAKAADAKVCAELESKHSGIGRWFYGDYEVNVDVNELTVVNTKTHETFHYAIVEHEGEKTEEVTASSAAFQAEVNKLFNLNGCTLGTCLTAKNIQKNFGWDDTDGKLKKCFAWSANATAIVNPECKIEIPKTGDVSVVAYAVMALVAAAGAMGLKK